MAVRLLARIAAPALIVLGGCTSVQHLSQAKVSYDIVSATASPASDPDIEKMIAPYKVQVDEKMNEVIAEVSEEMTRKKPESTLGNWITDAMMAGAQQNGYEPDLAIHNYGGIRVPYITAGPLTRGELYELSPFDNMLVIVDMPGDKLDSLFQHIAATEGWPVSAGVRMTIRDKVMVHCTIDGQPIDPAKTYQVAMPDYVANGGDGTKLLIPLSRVQTSLLVRDLLIGHALDMAKAGKKVTASIEGRTVIQN